MSLSAVLTPLATAWWLWDTTVRTITFLVLDALDSFGWETRRRRSVVTKDWLFVNSPTDVITLNTLYLAIVLGTLFKTSRQKERKLANGMKPDSPLWLKRFVLLHNSFLIVLSAYMCFATLYCIHK